MSADVQNQLPGFIRVRYHPVDHRRARRQLGKSLLESRPQLCDGAVHALVHQWIVGVASHHADLTHIANVYLYALSVHFAGSLRHRQHLGRVGAYQACVDLHLGADIVLGLHRAATKTAEASPTAATSGLVGIIVTRDGAQNNGINTEYSAQLGGGDRIGAVSVAKVLLRQELIDGVTLDHAHVAVLDQTGDQKVGGSFSEIGSARIDER